MTRFFLLVSCVVVASCSLTEGGDSSLREVWRVEDDITSTFPVARRGGLDTERFYAVRERTAQGRRLAAYSRASGEVVWQTRIPEGVCDPPVVAGGRVFCPANSLHAFDAASGASLWTLPVDSSLALVEGTADAARVFAGSLTSLYAADAATGALLWRRHFSGPDWRGIRMRSVTLTPTGDTLLAAFDALYDETAFRSAAVVVALDPITGAEHWLYRDGDATTDRQIGTLTLWRGLMLYSDATGQEVVAVDRRTREVRWRAPWTPGYLGSIRAPAVVDGVAYWGAGDERVYAADAGTGAIRWSVRPDRGSYRNHEVCGGLVLADNTALTAVDRATGASRGVLFDDEVVGQTAVGGGQVYISAERGVYAFDCG